MGTHDYNQRNLFVEVTAVDNYEFFCMHFYGEILDRGDAPPLLQ